MGVEDSPYARFTQRLLAMVEDLIASGQGVGDAEEVARLIERIVNHPHPRLRYLIGTAARKRYLVRRILPFRWYCRLVLRKVFGPLQKTTGPDRLGTSGQR